MSVPALGRTLSIAGRRGSKYSLEMAQQGARGYWMLAPVKLLGAEEGEEDLPVSVSLALGRGDEGNDRNG